MSYSSNALYELIQERYRLLSSHEISTISVHKDDSNDAHAL